MANQPPPTTTGGDPVADRRRKLERLRDELGVDPFGGRTDGLCDLQTARSQFDPENQEDARPSVAVAGRVMLHRDIGKLIFMTLRDQTGDLQVAISKKQVDAEVFKLAKLIDMGDVVVVRGRVGATKTGEITVWAEGNVAAVEIACKSLAPPPEKWKGLQDAELRYRRRYVDMVANPQVLETFMKRSAIVTRIRQFLSDPPAEIGAPFVEVETPMMQPIVGGAAARPFLTHHNALDIDLYLRIAPELYLKRLLVGGMPRVYEINRNFRNEGIDHSHNPEFTMLELYEAFGDYRSMMALAEQLIHALAVEIGGDAALPFGEVTIDYAVPFRRATYHDLFAEHNGFDGGDTENLVERAGALHIEHGGKDHDVLLSEVWDRTVESNLVQPTFVIDYPASLCPLTRPKTDQPQIAERFELFIANMELANAYTELNDPDVQEANFRRQIRGLDEDEATFRNLDNDFLDSLRVGMPPAGGLGIGIDRLVMLLTNSQSIRDVILFPLMRPQAGREQESGRAEEQKSGKAEGR